MSSAAELVVKAALVGIGGTIVLDLGALFMARVMGRPATDWAMVGRWFGNMPRGRFVQETMTTAEPVKGELAIGWKGFSGPTYGPMEMASTTVISVARRKTIAA